MVSYSFRHQRAQAFICSTTNNVQNQHPFATLAESYNRIPVPFVFYAQYLISVRAQQNLVLNERNDVNLIKIYINKISYYKIMSFQNTVGPDGSININVIPSFGRIVNVVEPEKDAKLRQIEAWRAKNGALRQMPADFDPSRYVSFSTREVVEEPVDQQHIHEYVERSRLSRRLGF